eukprot:643053-Pelagomonas_calceolata.AAC.1
MANGGEGEASPGSASLLGLVVAQQLHSRRPAGGNMGRLCCIVPAEPWGAHFVPIVLVATPGSC